MNETLVTKRQASAAGTAALLSPLLRALPRMAVLPAGRAAALSLLPAVPLLLLLGRLLRSLRRSLRPGEGMAGLILRRLGPAAGRLLLLLWTGWFLVYAAFILRSGAERLTSAVYLQSRPEPFLIGMAGMSLLAALGPLRAAARMGTTLRSLLLAVLAAALLLAAPEVSPRELLPLYREELAGAVLGAWPFVTLGSTAALFSFLDGNVRPEDPARRNGPGPVLLPCIAGALLCFVTVGAFGPALTARLTYPFFTLVRDVSLLRLAPRIEAAVLALWVLADLMICTLLLRCAHEAVRTALRLPSPEVGPLLRPGGGRWLLWAEAAVVLILACAVKPGAEELLHWSESVVPLLLNGLVFGSFGLLWLVGKLRRLQGAK